uniref:DUF429 domain-containing protein n=1 Tax=Desulfobacca acetoxidans TaxID=60893 RepID=A0A7V4G8M2_9BACT
MKIYGIDFSGAAAAGKHIWIAAGRMEQGKLCIKSCRPAAAFLNAQPRREVILADLARFVGSQENAVFAFDFPFGLPVTLLTALGYRDWQEMVLAFPRRFPEAHSFRQTCKQFSAVELKRTTDRETKTPFSPYNLRMFRQTYYGISTILHQVVAHDQAAVLPMQPYVPGKAAIIEICPAATLQKEMINKAYRGYKSVSPHGFTQRAAILAHFEKLGVVPAGQQLRKKILADPRGDALDSLIAGFAAYRAYASGFAAASQQPYALEGFVYT